MPGLARAAGRLIIRSLVGTGLGSNAIIRAVQGQGFGYQRTLMLDDINQFSGHHKSEYFIKKLTGNQIVPYDLMTPVDMVRPRNFMVYFDTTYYDPTNDTYTTTQESMYTNDYADIENWQNENEIRPKPNSPPGDEEFVQTRIKSVDIDKNYLASL